MTIPEHLLKEVRKVFDGFRNQVTSEDLSVRKGQIRAIKRGVIEEFVLVVGIHQDKEVRSGEDFCQVMLIHHDPELATNDDLIVRKESGQVPYDVVIQSNYLGTVWKNDLSHFVSCLDDEAFEALGCVWDGEIPNFRGFGTGVPLEGPSDARWLFKEVKGEIFDALTGDCTAELHGQLDLPYTVKLEEPRVSEADTSLEEINIRLADLKKRDHPFVEIEKPTSRKEVYDFVALNKQRTSDKKSIYRELGLDQDAFTHELYQDRSVLNQFELAKAA